MIVKCPKCSAEMEYIENESEFCSDCGSALKTSAASAIPGSILSDILAASSQCSNSMAPTGESWDLSSRSREIAETIESREFEKSPSSECTYLKVEYNHNLFFLTNSTSVIKLKLTPQDNRLQDLLIFMETERDGQHARRQIPVREVLQREKSVYVQLPFDPEGQSGRMFMVFYIGCKVNGSFSYYQFSVEHKVYDSRQSGNSICSQITIQQAFTSSQASDINYSDSSLGDALKKMAEKTVSVNEMIDRLNDLPPDYRTQYLTHTTWRPEDALIKGNVYPTDKLLLEYNGQSIFLLNKPSVKFGRDPEQVDLLVRCGQGKLSPREYPNSTVSRKHAEILYCEDAVKLFDYSSYGTYINDRKPDSSGIPLDLNALVEFGDIHWKMNIQKCNYRLPHNICQTCTAGKIRSVTFTRTDEEPECYLLIWQCCELGRVIEDLADWTIFSRNGCFFIRTPDQDFYHLRPGQKIMCKNALIKVKYFEQY